MKVSRFELWLIRNDPEIREAPLPGISVLGYPLAPLGGVILTEHKRRCIALTGRDDKFCVCAIVPDDPRIEATA